MTPRPTSLLGGVAAVTALTLFAAVAWASDRLATRRRR